jgi:hypothetical protein
MNLHLKREQLKELILVVSEFYKIDKSIVEKDYWVTFALYKLLSFEKKDFIIFRGGTSLTKCYVDLKRFSEDIDLAINKVNEISRTKLKKLIKEAEKHIAADFKECPGGTKREDYRDVEYKYPSVFDGAGIMEMNPNIKIETVSFMTPNPFEKRPVKSIIYNYLEEKGLMDFIKEFGLEPFEINVLSVRRTVIDKIVALVRMSYKTDLKELRAKTRHLYDLHLTYMNMPEIRNFYGDKADLLNIIKIVRDDEEISYFKDQYSYKEKWSEAPLWELIKDKEVMRSYEMHFGKEFVYGELPEYPQVLKSMHEIRGYLKNAGE